MGNPRLYSIIIRLLSRTNIKVEGPNSPLLFAIMERVLEWRT